MLEFIIFNMVFDECFPDDNNAEKALIREQRKPYRQITDPRDITQFLPNEDCNI